MACNYDFQGAFAIRNVVLSRIFDWMSTSWFHTVIGLTTALWFLRKFDNCILRWTHHGVAIKIRCGSRKMYLTKRFPAIPYQPVCVCVCVCGEKMDNSTKKSWWKSPEPKTVKIRSTLFWPEIQFIAEECHELHYPLICATGGCLKRRRLQRNGCMPYVTPFLGPVMSMAFYAVPVVQETKRKEKLRTRASSTSTFMTCCKPHCRALCFLTCSDQKLFCWPGNTSCGRVSAPGRREKDTLFINFLGSR
jgi:hypothetical protein